MSVDTVVDTVVDTIDGVDLARERVFQIEAELATQKERLAGFEVTAHELEYRLEHLAATKQALINRQARGEDVADELSETRHEIAAAQSELSDVSETIATVKGLIEDTVKERATVMRAEQAVRAEATGDEALQKLAVARTTAARLADEVKQAATLFDQSLRLQGSNNVRGDLHTFAQQIRTWSEIAR